MGKVLDGFTYQYTVGIILFFIGLIYASKHGYVGFRGRGLRNLIIMLGCLFFFAGLQGYLQYAPMSEAPASTGDYQPPRTLVTKLDFSIVVFYFVSILALGVHFGKRQKTVKDFFFAGQKFSWWLITFSLIATTVGSYSFVKYSEMAYEHGLASSQTYLNDWIYMPLFIFGWLPLLYFSRVQSVPEYFQRRFGPHVRVWVSMYSLIYLVGYVGINLFTMGMVLNKLVGWDVFYAACIVAMISAAYVTAGGQTSVIMTDLFQGVMLLSAGFLIFALTVLKLGGLDELWLHLPRSFRQAFSPPTADPTFPSVGIFWQDAIANSGVYWFVNQGMIMRYLSAKSVREGRRAAISVTLILMPIAACVVASGGWAARALVHSGHLSPELSSKDAFYVATYYLSKPGVFGFILAALTAALMSTVDTLITAVSAITVNDFYKPFFRPKAQEKELLFTARITAIVGTLVAIGLVPVFMQFDSIYMAHGAFTAAVTPPLVVCILLSVFWRRFTQKGALAVLIGGLVATAISIAWPSIITPFAHGIPMGARADGFLGGMKQHTFMRSLFGLTVSLVIGVVVSLVSQAEPREKQIGLVWGTVAEAIRRFKGGPGEDGKVRASLASAGRLDTDEMSPTRTDLPLVSLSKSLAQAIRAEAGDLLYVTDTRWWLGGLHSTHAMAGDILETEEDGRVFMGPRTYAQVVWPNREGKLVRVERLY